MMDNALEKFANISDEVREEPRVQQVMKWLRDNSNFWFMVSKNAGAATSCKDAAKRRTRLGHVGIPLEDEMRSMLWVQQKLDGSYELIVSHARGNQCFNEKNIQDNTVHKQPIHKANFLNSAGDSIYGQVTPFSLFGDDVQETVALLGDRFRVGGDVLPLSDITSVRHVFDESLCETAPGSVLGTMMTNMGHLDYAIEFFPQKLVATAIRSEQGTIANIADYTQANERLALPKVAVITGNTPGDGSSLVADRLVPYIRDKLPYFAGDISHPEIETISLPILGATMEIKDRWETIEPQVLNMVRDLCERNYKVITLSCNTTDVCKDEMQAICKAYGAVYVSPSESVMDHAIENNNQQFILFALDTVAEDGPWSPYSVSLNPDHHKQLDIIRPSGSVLSRIRDLAYEVKNTFLEPAKILQKIRHLVGFMGAAEGVPVYIALTELCGPFMKGIKGADKLRIINAMDVHAASLAKTIIAMAKASPEPKVNLAPTVPRDHLGANL